MAVRIVILVVILGVCSASGAEILVPGDQATIRQAMMFAQAGDTVTVAAGTYYETGIPLPSGVVLRGLREIRGMW